MLARHRSWSRHRCFFAVGVVVEVVVVVATNTNTAAQGWRGCQLAIVSAVFCLIVTVVVLVSTIAIACDDDYKLPIVLLRLVQFFFVWEEL